QEGTVLAGADLAAFRAEKSRIDRIIAAGGDRRSGAPAMAGGLRPARG
ncbi:MAG: M23 family peptidase, partial [Brevundimonas sp.]